MRRVFLDENVEPEIEAALAGFEVQSIDKLKMKSIKNGALLRWLSEQGFEVLIAKDRNISFQNPLAKFGIGVVVLRGQGRLGPRFVESPEELRRAVGVVEAGEAVDVWVPAAPV